jgi:arsenate reductase (thioredoxin)
MTAHAAGFRRLHPVAVRIMDDLGIGIEDQRSKPLEAVRHHHFDQVITACDRAREACGPVLGIADPVHWSLPDPGRATRSQDEVYEVFRTSTLTIAARVRELLVQVGAQRIAAPRGYP